MAVRKVGKNWQIDYYDPDGKRIRRNFRLRKQAVAELAKIESLKAEGRYLDVKKESETTFGELAGKYADAYRNQRSFVSVKAVLIKKFLQNFGEDTRLVNFRYYDLETFRNHLRETPTQHGKLPTDASVNRWMSCLRHMFKKAVEWELIEKSPFDRGKSLILKENNKRMRFLSTDEITRLLDECPSYLKNIVACALNTGMRKSEILSLKWNQVRNGFIYLRKTKTNESRQIPVNESLESVFAGIRRREHLTSEYVFTWQGKRIMDVKSSFGAACRRAGLTDFHFHDLRHTCASHLVMNGASLKEVQEILGHTTMTMTLRYAHLSQEHRKRAVNLLNFSTDGHKMVTVDENGRTGKIKRIP